MVSIEHVYQSGHGPSSSHTMGPARACSIIKKEYPGASTYEVVLYNSLALTGKGHLTEEAIKESLAPSKVTFLTAIDPKKHPNTLVIKAYDQGQLIVSKIVKSVGGGKVLFDEQASVEKDIYPHQSFNAIKKFCKEHHMTLYDYILSFESKTFTSYLLSIWQVMKSSIREGLKKEEVLPGPLAIKRKAKMLYDRQKMLENKKIRQQFLTSYAYAVSEENASGGFIVTAPTCGASGVLPAVLYDMYIRYKLTDQKIIEALAIAGLIGNLIKQNASISGAVAGCQAEVGSACAMAAGAHASLLDLTIDQIEYAAEIALEHHLGLTCDPVNGYVQIPCIERNAVAALRAVDAAEMAFHLTDIRKVSLDTVIQTMYQTGLDMHSNYKETSLGGLAQYYKEDDDDVNCW